MDEVYTAGTGSQTELVVSRGSDPVDSRWKSGKKWIFAWFIHVGSGWGSMFQFHM